MGPGTGRIRIGDGSATGPGADFSGFAQVSAERDGRGGPADLAGISAMRLRN